MNKMYLRWTRSYVRESIFQARFVFTRYREKNRVLPIIDFIFLNFLHPFHLFSLGLVLYSFAVNPLFMLRHVAFLVISSFILSLLLPADQQERGLSLRHPLRADHGLPAVVDRAVLGSDDEEPEVADALIRGLAAGERSFSITNKGDRCARESSRIQKSARLGKSTLSASPAAT